LRYILAKKFDVSGDFDRAFAQAKSANDLEADRRVFEGAAITKFVDDSIAVFTPDFFEERKEYGSSSALPIFVVGLPRSGTTLVEQIIASDPDVSGGGELEVLPALTSKLKEAARVPAPYPQGVAKLDEPATLRLAGAYLRQLRPLAGEASHVTDKMPFNAFRLGVISLMLPRAKIINCRRHPLDIFISGYFLNFKQPLPYTADQDYYARYYVEYARIMDHWRSTLRTPILDVDYEDLIEDQEKVSRSIIEYCGLEWSDSCLQFHQTERPVRTGSSAQVRRPLYRSSVGHWRSYEEHLKPLKEALSIE